MTTRRSLLLGALPSVAAIAWGAHASAQSETATYQYDALGRLTRVSFSSGRFVVYSYDAGGNRREVIRSDGSTFTATLQLSGPGPINLRTIANAAGYNGAQNADITFQIPAGVTIMGAPNGGTGLDTGVWPSHALSIALTLQVSGKLYGGGGLGGAGGGTSGGAIGGSGGDAIRCQENLSVAVNPGGEIKAGGGGGGGGGSWVRTLTEPLYYNGGGGGGGFPNGAGGPEGSGDADVSNPGAAGAISGGGAGGTGGASVPGAAGRINGAGGGGGGAGASGILGGAPSGSGGTGTWTSTAAGQGGQPGFAIRRNSKSVPVTNSGVIVGAQG